MLFSKLGSVAARLVFIALLIGLWVVVGPKRIHACYCGPRGTPAEALAESAAVFEGKVISARDLERNDQIMSSDDPTTVEFEVTTVWKGQENRTIHLITPRGESSCGFAFVEGVEYIGYSS